MLARAPWYNTLILHESRFTHVESIGATICKAFVLPDSNLQLSQPLGMWLRVYSVTEVYG